MWAGAENFLCRYARHCSILLDPFLFFSHLDDQQ